MKPVECDWVLMAAHELRGTIASVESFLDAAVGASDQTQARRWTESARERSKNALILIDRLLFLERFDSAREAVIADFDLAEVVRELSENMTAECAARGIRIETNLPEALPVRASRHEMEMLFTNLIQNGIKYNRPEGILRIKAERKRESCRVAVEDEGIGIPLEEIGRIFDGFSHAGQL